MNVNRGFAVVDPHETAQRKDGMGEIQSCTSFEEIYKLYGERVLNIVYRFTKREDVARDLTQDVFMKIFQNLETFRMQSQVYTWIYKITVNHVLNHLKRERRHRWVSLMDENITDLLYTEEARSRFRDQSAIPSPHELMEKSEREKIVSSAVESLPVKYRVPFVLYRYEEMSYREIADAMSLSLSAVEARIHRAKKQLIGKLEPWLDHI